MELGYRVFSRPLVDAEDEAVCVFSLLDRGQDDILRRDRGEGVAGGQRAGMRRGDDRRERVVVLVAVAHGKRVLPRPRVGIERVVEVVVAHISLGVGPFGRAQQRQPQHVAHRVVAVLALVQNAQAVLLAVGPDTAEVGPAHRCNLKLRLLPTVVARGRPVNGSVGNLVRRKRP